MNVQLARRIDLLVRFYPTEWRLEQGSELKDHLLAVTSDSKSWPSLRETRGLVAEGLRARARGRRTNARDTFAMSLQYSLAWGVGLMFGALAFRLGTSNESQASIGWTLTAFTGILFVLALMRTRSFVVAAASLCALGAVAYTAVTISGQGGAYEPYLSRAISWRTQTLAFSVLAIMFVGVALLFYGRRKSAITFLAASAVLVLVGVWDLAAQVRDRGVVPRVGTGMAVIGTVWADCAAFLVVFGATLVAMRTPPTQSERTSGVSWWMAVAPVIGALLGSGSTAAWGMYGIAVILSITFAFINPCPAIVLTCAPYAAGIVIQWLSFGLLTIRQPVPEPVEQRFLVFGVAILTILYLGRSTRRLYQAT